MTASRHGRIAAGAFEPAFGLGNPHLQTLIGGAPGLRRPKTLRERWELTDGDFLDIDWLPAPGPTWVLVLAGLTGDIGSTYALRLMQRLAKTGCRAGLLNYRGRSGVPNRLAIGYHAGFTRDLDLVARRLAARHGPGFVAGYSMGGNLVLKWLGECGADAPVKAAAAVSVPFDLAPAAESLKSGPARHYDSYLLKGLKRYVRRKFATLAAPFRLPVPERLANIMEFDEHVTAPLHGFAGAADYYARASCKPWLSRIRVPTLIVNAIDDPLIPPATLPDERELSPALTLELSERGGHVGFVGRGRWGRPRFWLDDRLTEFLTGTT